MIRMIIGQSALKSHNRGVALMEFAIGLPVLALVGMGGLEMANYAMAIHKVSQTASAMADNLSRVGAKSSLAKTQLRETDIRDSFRGMERQANGLGIGANGRAIISSLERNADDGQWIHWQRCIGTLNHTSSYGLEGIGASGTGFPGMGPGATKIKAPPGDGQAVMFVEIAFEYKPLFTESIIPQKKLTSFAAFMVRSPRDTDVGVTNPSPGIAAYTCNKFTAT